MLEPGLLDDLHDSLGGTMRARHQPAQIHLHQLAHADVGA